MRAHRLKPINKIPPEQYMWQPSKSAGYPVMHPYSQSNRCDECQEDFLAPFHYFDPQDSELSFLCCIHCRAGGEAVKHCEVKYSVNFLTIEDNHKQGIIHEEHVKLRSELLSFLTDWFENWRKDFEWAKDWVHDRLYGDEHPNAVTSALQKEPELASSPGPQRNEDIPPAKPTTVKKRHTIIPEQDSKTVEDTVEDDSEGPLRPTRKRQRISQPKIGRRVLKRAISEELGGPSASQAGISHTLDDSSLHPMLGIDGSPKTCAPTTQDTPRRKQRVSKEGSKALSSQAHCASRNVETPLSPDSSASQTVELPTPARTSSRVSARTATGVTEHSGSTLRILSGTQDLTAKVQALVATHGHEGTKAILSIPIHRINARVAEAEMANEALLESLRALGDN
ncbi:MAG: hypothetical protein Q9162_005903 [Coniocarpon cinnabarinum]